MSWPNNMHDEHRTAIFLCPIGLKNAKQIPGKPGIKAQASSITSTRPWSTPYDWLRTRRVRRCHYQLVLSTGMARALHGNRVTAKYPNGPSPRVAQVRCSIGSPQSSIIIAFSTCSTTLPAGQTCNDSCAFNRFLTSFSQAAQEQEFRGSISGSISGMPWRRDWSTVKKSLSM